MAREGWFGAGLGVEIALTFGLAHSRVLLNQVGRVILLCDQLTLDAKWLERLTLSTSRFCNVCTNG